MNDSTLILLHLAIIIALIVSVCAPPGFWQNVRTKLTRSNNMRVENNTVTTNTRRVILESQQEVKDLMIAGLIAQGRVPDPAHDTIDIVFAYQVTADGDDVVIGATCTIVNTITPAGSSETSSAPVGDVS